MNLFALLKVGASYAKTDKQRQSEREENAAELARAKWLRALVSDQTRAWMNIGEKDAGLLQAFVVLMTIAGFVFAFNGSSVDDPDIRVIRGSVSAASQCSSSGCVISVDDARAFSSASQRAEKIIKAASVEAIISASISINELFKS